MANLVSTTVPTIFLKKIKYDQIIENYQNRKYTVMPEFHSIKFNNKKYIGTPIYKDGKINGFKTTIDKTTLILLHQTPISGLCAHCETFNPNICTVGIPEKITKIKNPDDTYTVNIYVSGETCSWECALICTKKIGRIGINLHPKYMDVNAIIRGVFNLYFPDQELIEAPGIMEFTKYGGPITPANLKDRVHLFYYKEGQNIEIGKGAETGSQVGSPKLVLNGKF